MAQYVPPAPDPGAGGAPSGPAGGQLNGTYPNPDVDDSHGGVNPSTHAATEAAAEATAAAAAVIHVALPNAHHTAFVQADHDGLPNPHHSNANDHANTLDHAAIHAIDGANHTGTLTDGQIPATVARDAEVTSAISTHTALPDAHHVDDNDPVAGEKAALAGTSGTPGAGNKYVTDADARNTNSRTPTAHESTHAPSGSDPRLVGSGSYTPGSMTVPDGTWMLVVDKLKLTSTQSLIARGTAVVRGIGTSK